MAGCTGISSRCTLCLTNAVQLNEVGSPVKGTYESPMVVSRGLCVLCGMLLLSCCADGCQQNVWNAKIVRVCLVIPYRIGRPATAPATGAFGTISCELILLKTFLSLGQSRSIHSYVKTYCT